MGEENTEVKVESNKAIFEELCAKPMNTTEATRQRMREYYATHKEQWSVYEQRHQAKGKTEEQKERRREYAKKWRENNRDKLKQHYRNRKVSGAQARLTKRNYHRKKYTKEAHIKRMFYAALNRAKKEGLAFDITMEDLTIPDVCPVLGIDIVLGEGNEKRDQVCSIDRIDNTLGYVKGNVQVISWRANSIKRDSTKEERLAMTAFDYGLDRDEFLDIITKHRTQIIPK